jgi:hypothetical protein
VRGGLRRQRLLSVAVSLFLGLLVAACGDDGDGGTGAGATPTTSSVLEGRVQRYPVTSANHVPGRVDYPQTPPVGGDHNAVWQNSGFYSEPVVSELAVHSMEHGAVWVVFRPSLPADQVGVLRQLARRPYVLVSPWPDEAIPSPVVASAWGLQLRADSATDPAVAAFVQAYANGPQTPEPGAPCTGWFGTPE